MQAFSKRITGFLLLVVIAISLVSCNDRSADDEALTVFRYNESGGILTLDPIYAKDLPHIWACNQLFNSLVAFDDSMNVVPAIAHSWEISDDGLDYTFHLRNDVMFHRNEAFSQRCVTANDVKYSFERVVDKSLNSPGSWIFAQVRHDDNGYAFEAKDDSTFAIHLANPFPPFLGILTMTYASVVPHEAVESFGVDFRKKPVGTGPFKFQYWKEGVKLVFRKNQDYFEFDADNNRLPYIDAVSVSFLIDKQVAFLEFIKGKFDFMSGIDARYKDELLTFDGNLREKYYDKIYLVKQPFLNTEYFTFNLEMQKDLGKEKALALRRAVNMSIDREKMLRYLRNGIGIPAYGGIIPVGLQGYNPTCGYSYQPKKAQQLVGDNGLNGYEVNLSTTAEYADIGKFVQSQIEAVGLKCKMEVIPPATMRSMRSSGSLAFFRSSWVADYPDAENYLSLFTTDNFSPAGPNYSHYSNSKFDDLYRKAMSCNDMDQREGYYATMDSLAMQDAPVVVLFYDEVLRFVGKRVSGLGSNAVNQLNLKKAKISGL